MKFYKLLFVVAVPLMILSCQKTIDTIDTSVAAKTLLNVSYGTSSEQTMDIYLPANRTSTSTKVIVMIHGGGWNTGDRSELTEYADSIRKRLPDYAALNINYRLATGVNLFPTQEKDVKSAIQFIINNSANYLI